MHIFIIVTAEMFDIFVVDIKSIIENTAHKFVEFLNVVENIIIKICADSYIEGKVC